MFNVLPHWKIICKIGKVHFKKIGDAEHIISPWNADFKESVIILIIFSWVQIRQRGVSQDCKSVV